MPTGAHQRPTCISAAVEGDVDEAVVRRLVREAGGTIAAVYGKGGKAQLDEKMRGYNEAARYHPWLVLRDLDHDAHCGPELRRALLPRPAPHIKLRLAVRATEAWLLGDARHIASFLGVPVARVPGRPEALDDPKRTLVDLAAASRSQRIRRALTPRPGSHRSVGPEYTSFVIEFAFRHWRPGVAQNVCPSLLLCRQSITALIALHP